jgi:hypothetical protein
MPRFSRTCTNMAAAASSSGPPPAMHSTVDFGGAAFSSWEPPGGLFERDAIPASGRASVTGKVSINPSIVCLISARRSRSECSSARVQLSECQSLHRDFIIVLAKRFLLQDTSAWCAASSGSPASMR